MIYTGIWIDKRKAIIISFENDKEQRYTIQSNIEDYHVKGGSGTKFKGGPQDVVQDSKYLERENHQMKSFFEDIIPVIENADVLVIFGPAQMGHRFYKELFENNSSLYNKVKSVETADSMTDNQLAGWVRTYFKLN